MNCQPRYPADYDYAKGMLVMHKPWSVWAPLTDLFWNERKTIDTFLSMIGNQQLPLYVLSEYNQAVKYSQQWKFKCIQKWVSTKKSINLAELENEELASHVEWEHSGHLSKQSQNVLSDNVREQRVDLGINHDWTKSYFRGKEMIISCNQNSTQNI